MNTATCHKCNGKKTHVNEAIDGNGITASEMDEILHDDPDFLTHYLGGTYDVPCTLCKGKGWLDMSPEAVEQRMWEAEWEAERRAEARMLGEW